MPEQIGFYKYLKDIVTGYLFTVDETAVLSSKAPKASPSFTGNITHATNIIRAVVVKTGIADNSATSVFRITTVDEGSNDGGGFVVSVHALVGHVVTNVAEAQAVKGFKAEFAKITGASGGAAVSAVSELVETASAATVAGTRDVGAITMSVVATSAYLTDVQFTVDLTGTAVNTATVVCMIELVWHGFTTPPVIAGL